MNPFCRSYCKYETTPIRSFKIHSNITIHQQNIYNLLITQTNNPITQLKEEHSHDLTTLRYELNT